MLLSENMLEAGKVCLAKGFPFAIVLAPYSCKASFFAAHTVKPYVRSSFPTNNGFVISRFGKATPSDLLVISDEMSPEEVIGKCPTDVIGAYPVLEYCPSTIAEVHCMKVAQAVASRKDLNSKVVLSRLISISSDRDPFDVAEEYFIQFPSCFRTVYFTEETGLWIVASPEKLLCHDRKRNAYETVSLAGTRVVGGADWDEKNICEQKLVTDYISRCLIEAGLEPDVRPAEALRFGQIEHICTYITAVGMVPPVDVALRLSPTPALCGYPVDEAFGEIERLEDFDRECYGGFIGILGGETTTFYVNLRCCRCGRDLSSVDGWNYRLYAGGGINAMSDPRLEWEETERKSDRLRRIIETGTKKDK